MGKTSAEKMREWRKTKENLEKEQEKVWIRKTKKKRANVRQRTGSIKTEEQTK